MSEKKELLISKLKSASLSSDCEKEIFGTFKQNDADTIFSILERLNSEVKSGLPKFEFKYNDVFDTKENVKKFIESNKDNLNIYIDNYNRLLGNSKLFRTVAGHTFGTYHVTQLQQYVSDGSFSVLIIKLYFRTIRNYRPRQSCKNLLIVNNNVF